MSTTYTPAANTRVNGGPGRFQSFTKIEVVNLLAQCINTGKTITIVSFIAIVIIIAMLICIVITLVHSRGISESDNASTLEALTKQDKWNNTFSLMTLALTTASLLIVGYLPFVASKLKNFKVESSQ